MKVTLQGNRLAVSRVDILPDRIEVDALWPVQAIAVTYRGQLQKTYRYGSVAVQPLQVRWCRNEAK